VFIFTDSGSPPEVQPDWVQVGAELVYLLQDHKIYKSTMAQRSTALSPFLLVRSDPCHVNFFCEPGEIFQNPGPIFAGSLVCPMRGIFFLWPSQNLQFFMPLRRLNFSIINSVIFRLKL